MHIVSRHSLRALSNFARLSTPSFLCPLRELTTTYYDSQSGRTMNIPGAEGIRLHDRSSALSGIAEAYQTDQALLNLISLHASVQPYALEVPNGLNEETFAEVKNMCSNKSVRISSRLSKTANCDALLRFGIKEALIEVSCESECFKEDLGSAVELAQSAIDTGLDVRAYVTHAFAGEPDGENMNLTKVQEAVTALADCGANIVMVEDSLGQAHEDSLREVVEEAFYLDVVGDTMLERLGISASLELTGNAARLGVQHFDVSHGRLSTGDLAPNMAEVLAVLDQETKMTKVDREALEKVTQAHVNGEV